jgi:hypothetical protein
MIIPVHNFGEMLISRPAGREAALMAKAYVFRGIKSPDDIILDFNDVKVLTPSWADEFISGIRSEYSNIIQCINTENPSVKASLRIVLDETN